MSLMNQAIDFIHSQKLTLISKSFSDLEKLKEYTKIEIPEHLKKFEVGLYKDKISLSEIRIVIQCYLPNPYIPGMGSMTADGFIMNKEGKISEIPEKDMYEFL